MNNTEEFRRQCEARHVMKLNKDHRHGYYAEIQRIRGMKAADELIAEVKKQYKLSQSQGIEV